MLEALRAVRSQEPCEVFLLIFFFSSHTGRKATSCGTKMTADSSESKQPAKEHESG